MLKINENEKKFIKDMIEESNCVEFLSELYDYVSDTYKAGVKNGN